MKIFQGKTITHFVLCAILLGSCVKQEDFDFNKVTSGELNPEFAVPLIHSQLGIADIAGANGNGMISVNNDRTVNLIYSENIYSKWGYEYFTPVDESNSQTLLLNSSDSSTIYQSGSLIKTVPLVMQFSFPNNQQIDSLTFRRGDLRINIQSEIPHSGILNISIPEATKNGQPFSKDIPFNEYTSQSINVQDISDMSEYNMKTNINGIPNRLNIIYTLTFNNSNSTLFTINKPFNISTSFDQITPASMFGYFGQGEFLMPSDTSNLRVFNNIGSGTVYFDDPKMTISIKNSFGMPLDAQLGQIKAILGNGTQLQLTGPIPTPLIDYPLLFGQQATTNILFDQNNSNIKQIINSAPKYLVYGIDAGINSPLPTYNFMADSSEFRADLRIEIPLKGYAAGFVVQDTIDFSIGNIEEMESAVFRLNISNGFPINVYTQVYFTNENNQIVDSLLHHSQNLLLEAAELMPDGKTTIPTKRMTDEAFAGARLDRLLNAKKVIVKGVVQTLDAPSSMINIYDDYKIDFKLGVKTKLRIDF